MKIDLRNGAVDEFFHDLSVLGWHKLSLTIYVWYLIGRVDSD